MEDTFSAHLGDFNDDHAGPPAGAPIVLDNMGSFFFGGTAERTATGETFHGDHGYAQFFIPQHSKPTSLVFWHGRDQSGKTWESTPDGRDGFWQIFTRRRWPVYIIDQPRRGRAARTAFQGHSGAADWEDSESATLHRFRLGRWNPPNDPELNDGVQFPADAGALEQFLRQQVPNTGPEPYPDPSHRQFLGGAVASLVGHVGPSVLFTHSHSGQHGWAAAILEPELVRGVVALEVGEYAFPSDAVPADVPTSSAVLREYMAPQLVHPDDFARLTEIPILLVFGDHIEQEPSENFERELWRIVRERARQFVETVNARGGHATLLELPKLGICGNSHFPMADLNNMQIADLIEDFLVRQDLASASATTPRIGKR